MRTCQCGQRRVWPSSCSVCGWGWGSVGSHLSGLLRSAARQGPGHHRNPERRPSQLSEAIRSRANLATVRDHLPRFLAATESRTRSKPLPPHILALLHTQVETHASPLTPLPPGMLRDGGQHVKLATSDGAEKHGEVIAVCGKGAHEKAYNRCALGRRCQQSMLGPQQRPQASVKPNHTTSDTNLVSTCLVAFCC